MSKSEERWEEAKQRMLPGIEALFRQNFGIDGPESEKSAKWILDKIFKPEYLALVNDHWEVWRQDDNGNSFKMESGLSYEEAKAKTHEYESRGHKQFYWFQPEEEELRTVENKYENDSTHP